MGFHANRRTVLAAAGGLAATGALSGTARAHGNGGPGHGPEAPVKEPFGKLEDGTAVERWTFANGGIRLSVITFGGAVQSLEVPDRHGKTENVSLSFDRIEDYVAHGDHFGALIGRYGNRIAGGRFTLDGKTYKLPKNDGENSLHGGPKGSTGGCGRPSPSRSAPASASPSATSARTARRATRAD